MLNVIPDLAGGQIKNDNHASEWNSGSTGKALNAVRAKINYNPNNAGRDDNED